MAVGHEPEGGKGLLLGDFSDVVPELFVGLARVAGASLGFHDGEHIAACVIQAIVGDAVPRLRVIAINGNLPSDLGAVVEFPVGSAQHWVDLQGTGLGFVERHCYHAVKLATPFFIRPNRSDRNATRTVGGLALRTCIVMPITRMRAEYVLNHLALLTIRVC